MKKSEAESFEITEYGVEHEIPGRILGIIQEIIREQNRNNPSYQVSIKFMGNLMKISYVSYELNYPGRKQEIEDIAKKVFTDTLKNLKREFKKETGKALDIIENKEMSDFSVSKVSLNERYMFIRWKVYTLNNFKEVTES